MAKTVYALLVGIDKYQSPVPALQGCTNDARAMQAFLEARVRAQGFELKLQTLLDQEAGCEAIIEGFREHLSQAKAGDVALFYYAGHGAQEMAPEEFWALEPDRLNETLVCVDSRRKNQQGQEVYDLADKELSKLIAEVAQNKPHILIILDCCHSGSGTRDAKGDLSEAGLRVRRAPLDRRERPLDSYIFSPGEAAALSRGREMGSDWLGSEGQHVLFAACRSNQTAKETTAEGSPRGAFTVALIKALQQPGNPSYRDVLKRVENQIAGTIDQQNPVLEPFSDLLLQPFLGGAVPEQAPYYILRQENNLGWVMDAGALHGLPAGQSGGQIKLAVFAADSDPATWAKRENALGAATVIEVLPGKSKVEVKLGSGEADPNLTYKAIVTGLPLAPLEVALEGDPVGLALVENLLKSSPFAQKATGSPKYRVLAQAGAYWITKPGSERPLVDQLEGFTAENADKLVGRLEHIARWRSTKDLQNPTSRIAGQVVMEVYQVTGAGPDSESLELLDGAARLEYRQDTAGQWQRPRIKVKLINQGDKPLFCGLLGLTESFEIAGLLRSGVEQLEPGRQVWVNEGKAFPLNVPDELWHIGITERQDVLKLIVCTDDFDLSLMTQDKLDFPRQAAVTRSALRHPLQRLMRGVATRDFGGDDLEYADWATDAFTLTTVRPMDAVKIMPDRSVELGSGLKVQPHPTLKASVKLSTTAGATRSGSGFTLPPVLQEYDHAVQPLQFSSTRGSTPALEVFELTGIENPQAITPENPLVIEVPGNLERGSQVIPMAYYQDEDGSEYYLPLGYAKVGVGTTEVQIQYLPQLPQETSEARVRSVFSALKMMFLKIAGDLLGVQVKNQRLAIAEVPAEREVNYISDEAEIKNRVAQARRILLYVHGILGDTRVMVGTVVSTPRGGSEPISQHYDLALTFDYENLNTSIKETGKRLREALEKIGLGPGHGKELHIVAHSMGGLVSRWFVEHEGGAQDGMVQQLVMLGTPNAGSPWVKVQEWVTYLVTLAVNGLTPTGWAATILGGMVALLNGLERVDTTADQMKPGSDFLRDLGSTPPASVPYGVIAGDAQQQPISQQRKLAAKLLDGLLRGVSQKVFQGQPNDLAASVESVQSIAPAPKPAVVGSDHFSYFVPTVGLGTLAKALLEGQEGGGG